MPQLKLEQRYKISTLLQEEKSYAYMAQQIGVHKSTISREIKRNCDGKKYIPDKANRQMVDRKQRHHYKLKPAVKRFIKDYLQEKNSPEQIGQLLQKRQQISISFERIYLYIYRDKELGGTLYKHLLIGHTKRRKRSGKYSPRIKIVHKKSIRERPISCEKKTEIVHFEIDTIIGKNHQSSLLILVERVSKFSIIYPLIIHQQEEVREAFEWIYKKYKQIIPIKSFTSDNGIEFMAHREIEKLTKATFYFADPYSPWTKED